MLFPKELTVVVVVTLIGMDTQDTSAEPYFSNRGLICCWEGQSWVSLQQEY